MATNPRHKSKASKAKLEQKLETLSSKIAKQGIYGVRRERNCYSIVNIPTDTIVVTNLPSRQVAESAAIHFNSKRAKPADKLQTKIDSIMERLEYLRADMDSFNHLLRNGSGDHFLYDRITETNIRIREQHAKIQRLFFI